MKEVFHAIHSGEVLALFEKLGIVQELREGTLRCHVCGDVITEESFGAVTRHHNALLFSCRKTSCTAGLASLGK